MATSALEVAGYAQVQTLYRSDRTVIYRAVRADRAVILKTVSPAATDFQRARRRLDHEHNVLRSLAGVHGVPRVSDFVSTPLGPALELLDDGGAPIANRLDAPWALDAFFETAVALVRIVAEVHARGTIHRDITPHNVLLGPEGVTLIDFALATSLDSVRPELRQLAGTLGYLAPEQTGRMNRLVDARSDLYSVGAVLFEMLAGRPAIQLVDPLAAIHATIARAPPSLLELRPDLPAPLAEIVAVLLNKMAEARYQSAYGLLDDLDHCAHAYRTQGTVDSFPLRVRDRSSRFQLPDRLYGREIESEALHRAYQRARAGEAVVVGVRGPAGVGKTALALELLREVASHGGLFAEGKFDALRRSDPHACLVDAIRRLLASLHLERGERGAWWRARLADQLGPAVAVLSDAMPELAALVGAPPPAPPVPAADGRRRFHDAMEHLLRALSSPREPMVLFLDDVQWADRATLDLLQQALMGWQRGSMLLVLSWRDEEIAPTDPLTVLLARLPAGLVQQVEVGPLTEDGVAALVRDALGCAPEAAQALARVVHQKTRGNAFFVREFLHAVHARGVLTFEHEARRWSWSIEQVRAVPATANVVDLVLARLRALPADAARLLGVAACLGATVDAELLLEVGHLSRRDAAAALVRLVEEHLLEATGDAFEDLVALAGANLDGPVGGALRFSHDRVQEAGLALVPADEREEIHLRIGRLRMAHAAAGDDPFPIVDQLNRALPRIGAVAERLAVARLNLAAGQRARRSGAFDAALGYLEAGLTLLPGDGWSTEYELAFALHLEASDASLLVPDRRESRPFAKLALAHARGVLDRVAAQEALIRGDLARYDNDAAVRRVIEALGWLGVSVSAKPSMVAILAEILKDYVRIRRLDRAGLDALPLCTDPRAEAAMRLLMLASSPSYYVSAMAAAAVNTRLVTLSVERGLTRYSAFAFQCWALILASVFGDVPAAERVGAFGRDLVERLGAPDLSCRVDTLYLGMVRARQQSWHAVVDPYLDAHLSGIEHGDAEYAALAAYNHATFAFLSGAPLDVVAARALAMEKASRRLGQERSRLALSLLRQVIAGLRGESADPARFDGAHVQAESFRREMIAAGDKAALAVEAVYRTAILVRLDSPEAAAAADDSDAKLGDVPGAPHVPYQHFHAALARIAAARRGQPTLGRARRDLRRLRRYAATAPDNHAHQVRLVEAELDAFAGRTDRALHGYEEALRMAIARGQVADASHTALLAARHLQRLGHHRAASPYLVEARQWLGAWGARALERQLEGAAPSATPATSSIDARSGTLEGIRLDATSALRAARAISTDMRLDALVRSLVETLAQATGADSALLVTHENGRFRVAARLERESIRVWAPAEAPPVDARPESVIRHATAGRTVTVLNDARRDDRFARFYDAPVSVLCVPLAKGAELLGAIYLENTLATSAFGADQAELAELLAGQAAVSLENARLYEDLRRSYDDQKDLAESFARFVPPQFLNQLGKRSVLDVHRGDSVMGEFTVLFADIRDFTVRAEQLGPERTFAFVNRYLYHVEPAIHQHGGFVHQLLGDGIVAVFPAAGQALRGALAVLAGTDALNGQLALEGLGAVQVGIGVNSGRLMMGAIGGASRLDRAIVGDVSNVASRIEGMTKLYGATLLVSGATARALDPLEPFDLRLLDRVIAKGKSEPMDVYEVLDALPPELRALRRAQRPLWDEALEAWLAGRADLEQRFARVLALGPDAAAEVFLQRIAAGESPGISRLRQK